MSIAELIAWLAQQLVELTVLLVGNLDGKLLVDPGVANEVHGAEAAAAQRLQNLILAELLAEEKHRRAREYNIGVEAVDNTRVFA